MSRSHKKNVPKRGDIFLIGGCLLAALVCCGLWLGFRKDGGAVVVEQEAYLDAHLTIQDVADRIGYSRSTLSGLF